MTDVCHSITDLHYPVGSAVRGAPRLLRGVVAGDSGGVKATVLQSPGPREFLGPWLGLPSSLTQLVIGLPSVRLH